MKKISITAGFAEALVKRWRWHQSSCKRAPDESCWNHWAPQNLALSTIFMDKINTACPFLPHIFSRLFGGGRGFLWCSLFYPSTLQSQLLYFTASVRITMVMILFCIVHKEKSTNLKLKIKSQQVEWKTANNYQRLSIFEHSETPSWIAPLWLCRALYWMTLEGSEANAVATSTGWPYWRL